MKDIFSTWPHQWICWIENKKSSLIPSLADLIDVGWKIPDRPQIVQYLVNAPILTTTSTDRRKCHFCDYYLEEMGTWLWDNKWLWPHSLAHLVEHHSLRLPDSMVENIQKSKFVPPTEPQCNFEKANLVWDEVCALLSSAYAL